MLVAKRHDAVLHALRRLWQQYLYWQSLGHNECPVEALMATEKEENKEARAADVSGLREAWLPKLSKVSAPWLACRPGCLGWQAVGCGRKGVREFLSRPPFPPRFLGSPDSRRTPLSAISPT